MREKKSTTEQKTKHTDFAIFVIKLMLMKEAILIRISRQETSEPYCRCRHHFSVNLIFGTHDVQIQNNTASNQTNNKFCGLIASVKSFEICFLEF